MTKDTSQLATHRNEPPSQQRREFCMLGAGAASSLALASTAALAMKANPNSGSQLGCDVSADPFRVWNVLCYEAEGDGETDDTVAIQNAIDAASSFKAEDNMPETMVHNPTGAGVVYLPPGVYKVSQPLHIPYGVSLCGAGPDSSIIFHTGIQECLSIVGTEADIIRHVKISDLTISGATSYQSGLAINLIWTYDSIVENVFIKATHGGVYLDNAVANTINNVKVNLTGTTGDCIRVANASNGTTINACRLQPDRATGNAEPKRGVAIDGISSSTSVVNCTFDYGDVGIELNATGPDIVIGTHITGNHFEFQFPAIRVGAGQRVFATSITGNFFFCRAHDPDPVAIDLADCVGVSVSANHFYLASDDVTGAAIDISDAAKQVALIANAFTGQWGQGVRGPMNPTTDNSIVEINNGGPAGDQMYPLRFTGNGIIDLPVRDNIVNPSQDEYGRFFVAHSPYQPGKIIVGVRVGERLITLAEE